MSVVVCTQFDQIQITQLPAAIAGCEECLKIPGQSAASNCRAAEL